MTGLIVGLIITGAVSSTLYDKYNNYVRDTDAEPKLKRNYLLVGAAESVAAGVVIGTFVQCVVYLFRH